MSGVEAVGLPKKRARVLAIGGSDSGGGAGIQADLKTAMALGAYATTAITAVTAQNTRGVTSVESVPESMVEAQIRAVLEDIGTDAVKTGMLRDARTVEAVARGLMLAHASHVALVIDPVMIAKGGRELLDTDGRAAVVRELVPRASLVTPNADEAALLAGFAVTDEASMVRAGEVLLRSGARAVLVKGGHVPGELVTDVLIERDRQPVFFRAPRIASRSSHGTGCTLATAIATSLAQGMDLPSSVERARAFVRRAMSGGLEIGGGHAPLDHGADLSSPHADRNV